MKLSLMWTYLNSCYWSGYLLVNLWLQRVLMHWGSESCRLGSITFRLIGSWWTSQLGFLQQTQQRSRNDHCKSKDGDSGGGLIGTQLMEAGGQWRPGSRANNNAWAESMKSLYWKWIHAIQQWIQTWCRPAPTCSQRWWGCPYTHWPPGGTHTGIHTHSAPFWGREKQKRSSWKCSLRHFLEIFLEKNAENFLKKCAKNVEMKLN